MNHPGETGTGHATSWIADDCPPLCPSVEAGAYRRTVEELGVLDRGGGEKVTGTPKRGTPPRKGTARSPSGGVGGATTAGTLFGDG